MNITGSKRSDAIERLETVLSSAPVVLFELDRSGRIVRSVGSGLASLGAPAGALLGQTIFEIGGPPRLLENVRMALEGTSREAIVDVDGLCYELRFVPLRDARGAVTGVLGLASDVTERARANELLDTLDAVVWIADAVTLQFTFVSPRSTSLTGYPEGDWVARPDFFSELLHPDDRQVARDLQFGAVRDGTGRHWVHRVITREGSIRWFATTIHMLRGGGQLRERLGVSNVRELLGLMTDVTDHLHAESTLQKSEARLQLVLGQLPAIIWTTDRQLRFTTSVGAGLTRLGVEESALVGHTVQQSLRTDDPHHPMLERIRRVIESGTPDRCEAEWFGRTYDTYVEPLKDGSGALIGALGLSLDVTEQKATEDALRRTEETLRQAQKMEAIGRIAGGVAHDFNNVLSVIVCHADLLIARGTTSAAGLQEIRSAAARAGDLTRQLLAFSRRQVLLPRVLDPGVTVSSVTGMLAPLLGPNIRVDVLAERPRGRVKVDATQLEQVVMNLVVNARDAMPEGGTLTVGTRNADIVVRDGAVPPGAYVVISVADTGTGMDEATRACIFEPFFTTKPVGQGTGLGLSTVLGIVEQSGGHVTLDSVVGRGTTFEIYLPRTEEIEPPPPSHPTSLTASPSATILLVEDQVPVRSVVKAILEEDGYQVIAVASAEEALRITEAAEPPIDLLLTDVVMPGLGGRELAKRVRAARPDARVLFMSGYIDGGPAIAPGGAFLQKPFTPSELEKQVRAALASRRT